MIKEMNIKKTIRIYLTGFLGFLSVLSVTAQEKATKYDLASLFEGNKIEVFNRQISAFSE
jgi:hypothetical protein